jgi:hypothetical protein
MTFFSAVRPDDTQRKAAGFGEDICCEG